MVSRKSQTSKIQTNKVHGAPEKVQLPPNDPLFGSRRSSWLWLIAKSITSGLSFLYSPTFTSIHDYWKNHSFDYTDLYGKVMSVLFNMLSRFVIAFLSRSKHLLISWLQSPSAVTLESKKIKSLTVSIVPYLFAMK